MLSPLFSTSNSLSPQISHRLLPGMIFRFSPLLCMLCGNSSHFPSKTHFLERMSLKNLYICEKVVPLHAECVQRHLRRIMAKKNEIAKVDTTTIQPVEQIESLILTIRGKQVILDRDLARLYGVETRVLNQAVQRNIERFPEDFMFQLTKEEMAEIAGLDRNVRYYHRTEAQLQQFAAWRPQFEQA